jgi:nitrogen fixation protein NifU and related proteins
MAGLEDLYREIIIDHYRNPRNKGELETPPAHKTEGMNPLCGDEIAVYLLVDGEDDTAVVTDIKIGGQGCSISQSSASMMSALVKGKSVAQARELIGAFKSLMNIHDAADSADDADGAEDHDHDHVVPEVKLGDIEALRGVVKFPVRIKCATLAWFTMEQGLREIEAAS